MIEKINGLLQEIAGSTATNAEELEALRLKYLSKKGIINGLMAEFREVPAEQKREVGVKINELKNAAQDHFNALKEQIENESSALRELIGK